ncbi:hypothetical protein GCM10011247_32690 [Pseudomonas plecoglossicida]|nr:hypothetical protein GCM10011247_32690 [Pseudomonas plecoglossicida]
MVVDCGQLLSGSHEQLLEQGQHLRQRVDELVKISKARLPIYIILTGAEALPGFSQWSSGLTPVEREQPVGLLNQRSESSAAVFLDDMMSGLVERLSELRIEQGMRHLPDDSVFELPECVASLRPRLEQLLLPAFAGSPYYELPLLGGLFLTARATLDDGQVEGWFSQQLLSQVLPAQRYAYLNVTSWRRWLPVGQAAIIAWLGVCIASGGLMIYGYNRSQHVISTFLAESPLPWAYEVSDELDGTHETLQRLSQVITSLSEQALSGPKRWLPYAGYFERLRDDNRAHFVRLFDEQIRSPIFEGLLVRGLQQALTSDDPRLIAAYVEFYVRQINLLDARLQNQPLHDTHELPDWGMLYQACSSPAMPGAEQWTGADELYVNYLDWQQDLGELRRQRAHALSQLGSIALDNRSASWLVAWAEQHGSLPPMRLGEYWADEAAPSVTLPGAYTSLGHHAVLKLLNELAQAHRDQPRWSDQQARLLNEYEADAQSAWYQFIQRFLLNDETRLSSQEDWRQALNAVGTKDDPYLKLLQRAAERFELIAPARRAGWASRVVEVDRLINLASQSDLHDTSGVLRNLAVTNSMGGDVLKGIADGGDVAEGVGQLRTELAQAKLMLKFQQVMAAVTDDLKKNDAQAFQVALDTWSFASDPQATSAPLWVAYDLREKLVRSFKGCNANEDVVWRLATGALDFSVRYAGQIAACQLQREWNGELLGVIEGVDDPLVVNALLYSERGALPTFMNGSVKTFTQRLVHRYSPREALGVEVPLNGAFYAYLNRMRHVQNDDASQARRRQIADATREQKKQALENEQKVLQGARLEGQQKLAALQAVSAVVELSTTASQVNLGARQLPRQTRLTVQCNGRSTVLDNYNFPTSATFLWAPQGCSHVSLEVTFSAFKLARHWTGDRAFIDFLRTFHGGQHTFTPDDFPNQRNWMGSENLTSIQLNYRQQGENGLLERYAQIDQVEQQLSALAGQLKTIETQLAMLDEQGAAQQVSRAGGGGVTGRGLAEVLPPKQIAWCWRRPPAVTEGAPQRLHEVELGVFAGDARVRKLLVQLQAMGYETRSEPVPAPLGQNLQRLWVAGLADNAGARKALNDVIAKLNVTPARLASPAGARQ